MMANGQLGVSNIQRHDISDSDYTRNSFSLSAFSIRWRPTFGVDLNCKNRVLNRRLIYKVMSKGESDGGLNSGGLLVKDFEFRPSFDEYLKVMESVRTVKGKKQGNGSRKLNFKENKEDKVVFLAPLSEGNEDVKKQESEASFDPKKASQLTKQDKLDGSTDDFVRKEVQMKVISDLKDRLHSKTNTFDMKLKRKPDSVKTDKRWLRYQPGGGEAGLEDSSLGESMSQRAEQSSGPRDHFQSAKNEYRCTRSSVQMLVKNGTNDNQSDYRSVGVERDKMHGGLERNWVQDNKIIMSKNRKVSNVASLQIVDGKGSKVERAVFRNFDGNNTIMGQPRVPQMEMEERIQQLAKW